MKKIKLLAIAGALLTTSPAFSVSAATTTVTRTIEPTTAHLPDFGAQFSGAPNKVGYNNTVPDRMFLDSLPVKCAAPQRITSAQFTIDVVKLTQGANRGDNDGLAFWNNPTSLFSTHMWTAAEPPNTPKQLTYNLGALPGLGAGQLGSNVLINSIPGASMLSSMQSNGRFSFSVQDDTMVRRATLTYTCEGGRVAVDSGIVVAPAVVGAISAEAGLVATPPGSEDQAHARSIGNLVYGLTRSTVTGGPCGPYRICFNVNVPPKVLFHNGSAKVVIEIMQNGLPVHTVISPTIFSDGDFCIDIPKNAPYLNPNLGGFDFHAAGQFFSGSLPLPPKVAGIRPFGVQVGLNNDIAYAPNSAACQDVVDPTNCAPCTGGTCCPPLTGPQMRDFFTQTSHPSGSGYNMVLNTSASAYANLVNGYQAYLTLLKFMCPSVVSLNVTFTPHTAAAIGGAFTSNLASPFSVNVTSSGATINPNTQFGFQFQPNVIYGVSATTVGLNAQRQPVDCGFTKDCNQGDRFTFRWEIGARMAGGSGQAPMSLGN